MPLLWMFLKSNWKILAIGIAVAVALGYIGILKHKISNRDKEISSLKVSLNAEKVFGAACLESANRQNAAIASIKAAIESQKKVGALLLAKAQEANAGLSDKAKWLEQQLAKPDNAKKDCSAALREWRAQ